MEIILEIGIPLSVLLFGAYIYLFAVIIKSYLRFKQDFRGAKQEFSAFQSLQKSLPESEMSSFNIDKSKREFSENQQNLLVHIFQTKDFKEESKKETSQNDQDLKNGEQNDLKDKNKKEEDLKDSKDNQNKREEDDKNEEDDSSDDDSSKGSILIPLIKKLILH